MGDYRKYFKKCLQKYYPDRATDLLSEIEKHYTEVSKNTAFALTSKNPMDRRLDFSAYFLSFIMTLDRVGESFLRIRELCLEITTQYVQPKNRLHAWWKTVMPKLVSSWVGQKLIKSFAKKIGTNDNPEGFIARIITDKKETFGLGYGVDIIECGICKLFQKHNYSRYASILCEVDKITTSLAGLEMIRNGTIANGAEKCDFRYKLRS